MKKVNFRNAIMALVVTLAFVFVGVQHASAQITPAVTTMHGGAFNVPTGNFVSPSEAQNILMARMLQIKEDMETQTGATLAANARLVTYYNGVRLSIESGQAVPEAIVAGLSAIMGEDLANGPSPTTMTALKQSAVNELSI